jgi:hypothetical protein
MNPYTYKKRGKKASQGNTGLVALGAGLSFLREVADATVSTSIGIAMVLFAAGSVVGLSIYAQAEADAANYVAFDQVRSSVVAVASESGAVLGESIVVEAEAPTVAVTTITATPFMYDAQTGKWDYEINYSVADSLALEEGSVSIGQTVLSNSAGGSDTLATDFVLKPGSRYEIAIWSKPGRQGEKLASMMLVTPSVIQ